MSLTVLQSLNQLAVAYSSSENQAPSTTLSGCDSTTQNLVQKILEQIADIFKNNSLEEGKQILASFHQIMSTIFSDESEIQSTIYKTLALINGSAKVLREHEITIFNSSEGYTFHPKNSLNLTTFTLPLKRGKDLFDNEKFQDELIKNFRAQEIGKAIEWTSKHLKDLKATPSSEEENKLTHYLQLYLLENKMERQLIIYKEQLESLIKDPSSPEDLKSELKKSMQKTLIHIEKNGYRVEKQENDALIYTFADLRDTGIGKDPISENTYFLVCTKLKELLKNKLQQ